MRVGPGASVRAASEALGRYRRGRLAGPCRAGQRKNSGRCRGLAGGELAAGVGQLKRQRLPAAAVVAAACTKTVGGVFWMLPSIVGCVVLLKNAESS